MATLGKAKYEYPMGEPDILRPVIVHVDGMSFRKCPITYRGYRPTLKPHQIGVYNEEDDDEPIDKTDTQQSCMDSVDDLIDIKELPNGEYVTDLWIPSVFYGYIIGRQGQTMRTIETDTKTKITIPRRNETGPVTIRGKTKRSLSSAKQRIEVVVWSNRQKQPPTHFIGIEINSDVVQERVTEFKQTVLSLCDSDDKVDEQIIQLPIKMHLTLLTLRLFTHEEEKQAITALEKIIAECKSCFSSDKSPPKIELKGIDCMNDDHTSVNTLHAKVFLEDGSQKLQVFADSLLAETIKEIPDLVKQENRPNVKLHATVMNSRWRDAGPSQNRGRYPPRISFDATKIFKECKDFDFGSRELTQVMLLKMGEKDERGFYKCIRAFDL